jgi:hypothetical protein
MVIVTITLRQAVLESLEGKQVDVRPDVQETLDTKLEKYVGGYRPQVNGHRSSEKSWFDEETYQKSALSYFFDEVKKKFHDLTEREFVSAFNTCMGRIGDYYTNYLRFYLSVYLSE